MSAWRSVVRVRGIMGWSRDPSGGARTGRGMAERTAAGGLRGQARGAADATEPSRPGDSAVPGRAPHGRRPAVSGAGRWRHRSGGPSSATATPGATRGGRGRRGRRVLDRDGDVDHRLDGIHLIGRRRLVCGHRVHGRSVVGRHLVDAVGHHVAAGPGQRIDQRDPPELQHQHPEVAGVEQLDADVGVELTQPPQLAVLLAHEALLERRELDVQVDVGQVEVGREALDDRAVERPQHGERVRLVLPADVVEVEDPRELRLARVGERGRVGDGLGGAGHPAPAPVPPGPSRSDRRSPS